MAYKKKAIKKTAAKKATRRKWTRKAKPEAQAQEEQRFMVGTPDGVKMLTMSEIKKLQSDQQKKEAAEDAALLEKDATTDIRIARFFEHIKPMLDSVKDGGKVVVVMQKEGFTPHEEGKVEVAGFRASPEFVGLAAFELLDNAPLANKAFKELAVADLLKA